MSKNSTSPSSKSSKDLQQKLAKEPAPATVPLKLEAPSSASSQASSQTVKSLRKMNSLLPPPEESVQLECLLLQDTTMECAPLQLRHLLAHYESVKLSQSEILLLLIYIVALESGYVTQNEYVKCSAFITKIPPSSSFHLQNVLRLARQVPTYKQDTQKSHFSMQLRSIVDIDEVNDKSKSLNSLLSALVTGDLMIVTLTQPNAASGRSICLSIGRYVLNGQLKQKPLQQRFRKLHELAMRLRDTLFVPVRNQQLALLETQIYPSLLGLPAELYDEIFAYLSRNQLNILANVCSHLNYLSSYGREAFVLYNF